MNERQAQIVRLLDARNAEFPDIVRRWEHSSGFIHRVKVRLTCEDCLANDRPRFGCETCGGRGYTEEFRDRDPMAEDKIQPYGMTPDRREAEQARDRQIAALEEQTRPASLVDEIADANASEYAWKRNRDRLFAKYHLAELERAIEWLEDLLPDVRLRGGLALGYFDAVLPDPLKAPEAEPPVKLAAGKVARTAGRDALSLRDQEIRRAVLEAAIPTADVARTWKLSVSQVNRIVSKRLRKEAA